MAGPCGWCPVVGRPGHDPLHQRHHRAAERGDVSAAAIAADLDALAETWGWSADDVLGSRPAAVPCPRARSGRAREHFASGVASSTPAGPRRRPTRPPRPRGQPVLRCADGLVAGGRRRRCRRRPAGRPVARVRQRRPARPGVRAAGRLERSGTDRAVRNDRDAHHPGRPRRRPAPGRLGRSPGSRCRGPTGR